VTENSDGQGGGEKEELSKILTAFDAAICAIFEQILYP